MARSVLGRGLKPLMDEAQVVTGIPTLSVDSKSGARPESPVITSSIVAPAVTSTESRSTTASSPSGGPSIYRRRAQMLPVGDRSRTVSRWPFWVADVVLLASALTVWLLAPRPMSLLAILSTALLIVTGAVIAVVPWLSNSATRPTPTSRPDNSGAEQRPPLQRLPFRLQ